MFLRLEGALDLASILKMQEQAFRKLEREGSTSVTVDGMTTGELQDQSSHVYADRLGFEGTRGKVCGHGTLNGEGADIADERCNRGLSRGN